MDNAYNIAILIRELAKTKGITINKMLLDCELGKSLIVDMERNQSYPTGDKLKKLADYLDVSVDYLLGRTSNSQSHKV